MNHLFLNEVLLTRFSMSFSRGKISFLVIFWMGIFSIWQKSFVLVLLRRALGSLDDNLFLTSKGYLLKFIIVLVRLRIEF